mmetsp:Transcript_48261/g.127787  ORF Transcript_48261/g.127787 Transcript_48261/m.127787 type:complete len:91 (+) Transcript_48261:454-726(+)
MSMSMEFAVGMVLALWGTTISGSTKPLGARSDTQVLGTGTRPTRWPRSVRCGCGSCVRDRGEPRLQPGRDQDVERVGNLLVCLRCWKEAS